MISIETREQHGHINDQQQLQAAGEDLYKVLKEQQAIYEQRVGAFRQE
jgi:hypothetical protein